MSESSDHDSNCAKIDDWEILKPGEHSPGSSTPPKFMCEASNEGTLINTSGTVHATDNEAKPTAIAPSDAHAKETYIGSNVTHEDKLVSQNLRPLKVLDETTVKLSEEVSKEPSSNGSEEKAADKNIIETCFQQQLEAEIDTCTSPKTTAVETLEEEAAKMGGNVLKEEQEVTLRKRGAVDEEEFMSPRKPKTEPDSGNETPDTDQEEEEYRRRLLESKKKGTKLLHRASFKRDKVDRHYDKLPWFVGAVARLLGLQLAPTNIPLHRRLETLAVLTWMSTFLFMGLAATYLLYYLFFYTQYWWVTLCYISWYIPDRTICNRGGRRIEWMRRWGVWKHFRNFFPIHVIKTTELDPEHNYIMCYHPHGILCAGAYCHFATEGTGFKQLFPGLTPYLLTLEILFLMPFYRELFLCTGAVSATRASMDYLLGREGTGRALCLVVGGAPESLDCHPGKVVLHLNRRMGFAKMALRHGASLVPMFAFGENDVYDQISNPPGSMVRRMQDFLQKIFGIAPCVFQGRGVFQYSLGIVPFRKPIYIVVGAPIHVNPVKRPTSDQILNLHGRYKEALVKLYNDYKDQYAKDPTIPIEFV